MMKKHKCPHCVGGYIERYSHIKGGKCFTCNGTGYVLREEQQPVKYAVVIDGIVVQEMNSLEEVGKKYGMIQNERLANYKYGYVVAMVGDYEKSVVEYIQGYAIFQNKIYDEIFK